jgi:hypothetical protein
VQTQAGRHDLYRRRLSGRGLRSHDGLAATASAARADVCGDVPKRVRVLLPAPRGTGAMW